MELKDNMEKFLRSPFPAEFLAILTNCPVKLTRIGVSYYADTPVPKHHIRSGENGDSVTRSKSVLSEQTWIFVGESQDWNVFVRKSCGQYDLRVSQL